MCRLKLVIVLAIFYANAPWIFVGSTLVHPNLPAYMRDVDDGTKGATTATNTEVFDRIKREADQMIKDKLQSTTEVYKLERTTNRRTRRDLPDQLKQAYQETQKITSSIRLPSPHLPHCTDVKVFTVGDKHYIAATATEPEDSTVIYKYHVQNETSTELQVLPTKDVYKLAVIEREDKIILLVMESNSDLGESSGLPYALPTGTVLYQFNRDTKTFTYVQRILTDEPLEADVFTLDDEAYVIFVAEYKAVVKGIEQTVSPLYMWKGGHLDQIADLYTYDILDLHSFVLNNRILIAVVNDTDAFILAFNALTNKFPKYQDLGVGGKDCQYFFIGEGTESDHFLVVANDESIIFKFHRNKFVPFQSLPTPGAVRCHAVTNTDSGLRVLAVSSDAGIEFYQYDGWRFVKFPIAGIPTAPGAVLGFASFMMEDEAVLVLANVRNSTKNIYKLTFTDSANVRELHDTAVAKCQELKDRIRNLTMKMEALMNRTEVLLYLNSSEVQYITANKTFMQNVSMELAIANKINTLDSLILDAIDKELFANVTATQPQIIDKLTVLNISTNNVVRKSGPQQSISGLKTFHALNAGSLSVNNVNVNGNIINRDVNLTELTTNTWYNDRDQTVAVAFGVNGDVGIDGDLEVAGTLDGVHLSTMVLLTDDNIIAGRKQFSSTSQIQGDLVVSKTIDGVNVSASNLLLTSGTQTLQNNLDVTGTVTFNEDVEVVGTVDGCDVSSLASDAVMLTGNFTVSGDKVFTGDLVSPTGIMTGVNRTIDNISIVLLDQVVVKTTGDQTLTGNYTFTAPMTISGDLTVGGLVDGLRIPADVLFENCRSLAVLLEDWAITDNATMNNVIVRTSIDGIQSTGNGLGLDVLLTEGSGQVLDGNITFTNGVHLNGSSLVAGYVDGVDIPSLVADSVHLHGDVEITGEKTFASASFQQNLTVAGLVNGIDIAAFDANALKLSNDGSNIILLENVTLLAPDTKMAGPLITDGQHTFSGDKSIADLVIQGVPDDIYGRKTFDEVSSRDDVVVPLTNGINIATFYNQSVRIIPDEELLIDAMITLWDNVTMTDNLTVASGIIDGISTDDIVTVFGETSVNGTTTFLSDTFAVDMNADNITMSGLLDGYDIQDIDEDTLKKELPGRQSVLGKKTFLNDLTINDNLIVTNMTNGVDLSAVAADAVYINHNWTQITNKTFAGFVAVTDLDARGLINDVNLTSFSKDVVLQSTQQTIEGAVNFTEMLHYDDDVTVAGTINGHYIDDGLLNVLTVTDGSYDGNLVFSDVVCMSNVTVLGLIDDMDLSELVLRSKETVQTVSKQKTFTGSLTVLDNATFLLINDVDVNVLDSEAVRDNVGSNISGYKILNRGIALKQNMNVTTLVDGVDVRQLAGNSLLIRNDGMVEQVVTGNGSLSDIYVLDNVTLNGTLAGIDLKELEQTYMSLTLPQTVIGDKTLQDALIISSPYSLAASTILLGGDLNGVNLPTFSPTVWVSGTPSIIHDTKKFTGNVTMESDLILNGTLNELAIPDDIMLTDVANIVTGFKNFTASPLSVGVNIDMDPLTTIDGVDVSEFKLNAVTLTSNYCFDVPLSFQGIYLQKNLQVGGELDGLNVTLDGLLWVSGTQVITAAKTFIANVSVTPNIILNGLLNGVNLTDLFLNTLLISAHQEVSGNYTFSVDSIFGNITTMADVDGVRIPELYRLVNTYPSFERFNSSLAGRCQAIEDMHSAQKYAAVVLTHLEYRELIANIGYGFWYSYYYKGDQWLIWGATTSYPAPTCLRNYFWKFDNKTLRYEYEMRFEVEPIVDIGSFVEDDRLFLVLAGKTYNTSCPFPTLRTGDDIDGIKTLSAASVTSTYTSLSTVNVLVRSATVQSFYQYQNLPCINPSDVEMFVDPLTNETCIAIANELYMTNGGRPFISTLPSYIYCLESKELGFYHRASITTKAANKIRHFFEDGILHLAVANRLDDVVFSFETESVIFRQRANGSFVQVASVTTSAAIDILPLNIADHWLIAVANAFAGTLNDKDYDIPVEIYEYEDDSLTLVQEISINGALALESFSTEDEHFLLIIDHTDTFMYHYRGIEVFVQISKLGTYGATALFVFERGNTGLYTLAIAQYEEEDVFIEEQTSNPIETVNFIMEFIVIGEKIDSLGCGIFGEKDDRRPPPPT